MFSALISFVTLLVSSLFGALSMAVSIGFTDRIRVNEFLKWEVNQLYCRDAATIKSTSTATIAAGQLQPGWPLKKVSTQYVIAHAGDEASVVAMFLGNDSSSIPEALATNVTTAAKYQILIRGPALYNKSIIPANDPDGSAYTLATIVTSLAALNIVALVESSQSTVQST